MTWSDGLWDTILILLAKHLFFLYTKLVNLLYLSDSIEIASIEGLNMVELLLPTVKWNRTSQPISVECKMMHGINQPVFRT